MPRCPICDAAAKPRPGNPSFPFCSARCKTIDLGKWVSEEYRIPGEAIDAEREEGGTKSGSGPEEPVRN